MKKDCIAVMASVAHYVVITHQASRTFICFLTLRKYNLLQRFFLVPYLREDSVFTAVETDYEKNEAIKEHKTKNSFPQLEFQILDQ